MVLWSSLLWIPWWSTVSFLKSHPFLCRLGMLSGHWPLGHFCLPTKPNLQLGGLDTPCLASRWVQASWVTATCLTSSVGDFRGDFCSCGWIDKRVCHWDQLWTGYISNCRWLRWRKIKEVIFIHKSIAQCRTPCSLTLAVELLKSSLNFITGALVKKLACFYTWRKLRNLHNGFEFLGKYMSLPSCGVHSTLQINSTETPLTTWSHV